MDDEEDKEAIPEWESNPGSVGQEDRMIIFTLMAKRQRVKNFTILNAKLLLALTMQTTVNLLWQENRKNK